MKIIIIIIVLLLLFAAVQVIKSRHFIRIGVKLADQAVSFTREIPDAEANILMIGDSTCVGTGAENPDLSIAGRVGKTFPDADVKNLGVNGAKTHELIPRLQKLDGQHFNLIMLHIGGNDIVRFTDLKELKKSIETVLELATSLADNVTLTTTGNMATARLLPFGTRWLFDKQTRKVRSIFKEAAEKYGASYVDLFREKPVDPFAQDPDKFYAPDNFHPSGAGYGDWFTIIEMSLAKIKL